VDRISISRLGSRLDEGNRHDEIARLAITFNKMLARLESAFQMQRNFISYASHELRTPLTAITSQIEVMLEKERPAEYYREIALSTLEDIRNMSALSNGLLQLANASLDISAIRFAEIRLDELLWQARAELLKTNPEYGIVIEFENFPENDKELTVRANEQLLKIAFGNVMDNGCKFSADKQLRLSISTIPGFIELKFVDKGIGIEPHEIEKIFEPFYRADNARSIKGHGLGMTLTDKIIQLHEGRISISSRPGAGTTVLIGLPSLG
jgi:signal transduction histidine kinase